MCLIIDKDSQRQIEALRQTQPTIKGYSVKRLIAYNNVESLFYPQVWKQGVNTPMDKIFCNDKEQQAMHFCFEPPPIDLAAVISIRSVIIECLINTADITAIGTVDGFPHGFRGFIAKRAEWDGRFTIPHRETHHFG